MKISRIERAIVLNHFGLTVHNSPSEIYEVMNTFEAHMLIISHRVKRMTSSFNKITRGLNRI